MTPLKADISVSAFALHEVREKLKQLLEEEGRFVDAIFQFNKLPFVAVSYKHPFQLLVQHGGGNEHAKNVRLTVLNVEHEAPPPRPPSLPNPRPQSDDWIDPPVMQRF